jgi:hypothetical protein
VFGYCYKRLAKAAKKEDIMKKVSLLSIAAALTITTGVSAGTENPLYRPTKGSLYSITEAYKSKSGNNDIYGAQETFGYGFSDRMSVFGDVFYYNIDDGSSSNDGFGDIDIGASYRYLSGRVAGDVYGRYGTFLDKNKSMYGKYNSYAIGTKLGVEDSKYTIAGKAELNIVDIDVAGQSNLNQITVGIDGAYVFTPKFSGLLGVEYFDPDDGSDEPVFGKVEAYWTMTPSSTLMAFWHTDIKEDEEDLFGLRYGVQF